MGPRFPQKALLLNCQNFDFYQSSLGEILYCYGRAGRERLAEELGIHFVHGNKIGHIAEEYCCLHYVRQICSCCCQHLRGIGKHLTGLLLDAALYEITCSRINGYLTTAEYHTIHFYRLAVRADGRRRLVCTDYFHGLCLLII